MEENSLNLVVDVHVELSEALSSLGKKEARDMRDNYKFWSCFYMGRASQAYIILRKAGAMAESRFLIRPAIEIMFRLEAVRQKPELVYRIGYTETKLNDRKWLIALANGAGKQFDETTFDKRWEEFKKEIQAQFPAAKLEDKRLTVKDAAEAANLGGVYETIYATYCRYTHGALWAIVGELDEPVGAEDNYIMACCLLCAVESLMSIGADAPNYDSLKQRQESLKQEKIDKAGSASAAR
jgi:Family of unknown function (DUF5677)